MSDNGEDVLARSFIAVRDDRDRLQREVIDLRARLAESQADAERWAGDATAAELKVNELAARLQTVEGERDRYFAEFEAARDHAYSLIDQREALKTDLYRAQREAGALREALRIERAVAEGACGRLADLSDTMTASQAREYYTPPARAALSGAPAPAVVGEVKCTCDDIGEGRCPAHYGKYESSPDGRYVCLLCNLLFDQPGRCPRCAPPAPPSSGGEACPFDDGNHGPNPCNHCPKGGR